MRALNAVGGEYMTKEQIYDKQINPLVAQITELCKEHKINAHASFFLDDDLICTTHLTVDGDLLAMFLLLLAARCRNNIDSMFIAIKRAVLEGRFRDGGSMILSMMNRDG